MLAGELLGQLITQSITRHFTNTEIQQIDYLLPVPLHHKKQRQRGFNQTQLLSHLISKQLTIPILLETVKRHKQTTAQEGLSLQKRKKNLNNAFSITPDRVNTLKGTYIVIIDDVVTTGATVNSLCQLLLQAGVKQIDVWCICRTALPAQKNR